MKRDKLRCKVDDHVDTFAIDARTLSQLDLPSLSYLQTYRVEIAGNVLHVKLTEPASGIRKGNVLLVSPALAKKFNISERTRAKLSISNADQVARVQYELIEEANATKPILEGSEVHPGDIFRLEEGDAIKITGCEPGPGRITNQTLLEDTNSPKGPSKPKVRSLGHQYGRDDAGGFDRLAGKDDVIWEMRNKVLLPFNNPDLATNHLGSPLNGTLIYGPEGVGGSLVARATAEEANAATLPISAEAAIDLAAVRKVYRKAASQKEGCIVVIDPIDDIITGDRGNSAVAILQECMDNSRENEQVMTIAVARAPEQLPKSLLRAGRLEQVIKVGLPDRQQRVELFRYFLRKVKAHHKVDCQILADQTETYTGADIQRLLREAGMQAMIETSTGKGDAEITTEDILDIIKARGFP